MFFLVVIQFSILLRTVTFIHANFKTKVIINTIPKVLLSQEILSKAFVKLQPTGYLCWSRVVFPSYINETIIIVYQFVFYSFYQVTSFRSFSIFEKQRRIETKIGFWTKFYSIDYASVSYIFSRRSGYFFHNSLFCTNTPFTYWW